MDRRSAGGGRAPVSPEPLAIGTSPSVRTVTVRLDRRTLRGWHIRLLDQLGQRSDRRVRVAWTAGVHGLPSNAELLFRLEAAIHGLPRPGLATAAEPVALAPYEAGFDPGREDSEAEPHPRSRGRARGIEPRR
ncbi:hypothetical protein ACRAWG_05525 [Methylobacterium sp. P31]